MGKISINQVRVRLGKIMEQVVCGCFKEEYENIASQFARNVDVTADILAGHMESTDNYVSLISQFLNQPQKLVQINSFTHPMVIYCVGQRYHWITNSLVEKRQEETMLTPENDNDFFVKMLTQYADSLRQS